MPARLVDASASRQRSLGCVAAALASLILVSSGSASAQTCAQCTDQVNLLSPFTTLLSSPAGLALLNANLQTEQNIYLNASQARKIVAATDALDQDLPDQVLIHAFPANPNFGYNASGLPSALPLPPSVLQALDAVGGQAQVGVLKDYFGQNYNIYGKAYNYVSQAPAGDPRPFQVSTLIANNPFTPANSSLLAYQIQQTNAFEQNWQSYTTSPAFPSGHSTAGNLDAILFAVLAPGYYQQLVQAGVDYGLSRNVFGVHYPLDVIGGRIDATYVVAQVLSNNPLYSIGNPGSLGPLSLAMQTYLGGGGSSPYAAPCAGHLVACVANGVIPSAASYAQALQNYTQLLTYGLPAVGDQTLPPVVPSGAFWLIATRFPYLNQAQLETILATTELPSGVPLDPGTGPYAGWARLNLYAAASGYGAFPSDVTVSMNAARGSFNAFDIWSNNITGPGGLIFQGNGTLILAGNDSYTGGTNVQGGTLAVTGSLGGNLTIEPGAIFVSKGAIASPATRHWRMPARSSR